MNNLKDFNIFRDIRAFPISHGLIHAVIDASSVTVIFQAKSLFDLGRHDFFYLVLAYNLIAFAGQALIGPLIDRFRFWRGTALLGIVLTDLGVVALQVQPWLAMVLVGVGNACFHVGAGALSLYVDPGRATAPGLFVAPGALGLALGTYLGKSAHCPTWPFLLVLAASLFIALISAVPEVPAKEKIEPRRIDQRLAIILLLLTAIAIRALVGKAGGFACPKALTISFGFAAAAFAGKAMGGIIADRFGWIETTVGALLISALLIGFGGANPLLIVPGMFLFQMAMPVTLTAVAGVLPGRPGTAFGLTCLALIIGVLPTSFSAFKAYYNSMLFMALALLAAAAIYFALRGMKSTTPMKFSPKNRD